MIFNQFSAFISSMKTKTFKQFSFKPLSLNQRTSTSSFLKTRRQRSCKAPTPKPKPLRFSVSFSHSFLPWRQQSRGKGGDQFMGSSPPPSPRRSKGGNNSSNGEARFFDTMAKKLCWAKADVVQGRHPDRWRKDGAGNIVCKRFCNCQGCLCFEYDHIVPFSKGGRSTADNCQILQTRVNRFKSDKEDLDQTRLKGYSCDIQFTDKELDIIEMAVYGDIIRPGKECRCRTVAEVLGQYKSKDNMAACKLP